MKLHPLAFSAIAAALLELPLAAGCDLTDLVSVYTALTYTSDGQYLILEGTDGIYVSYPPGDEPSRLSGSGKGCEGIGQYNLGCVRIADDSSQVAILKNMVSPEKSGTKDITWSLRKYHLGDSGKLAEDMASGVLAAAYAPAGHWLVWTVRADDGTISLMASDGGEEAPRTLVSGVQLVDGNSSADSLNAFLLTSEGVAYGRPSSEGDIALWFQPFDSRRESRELGVLSPNCLGTSLKDCFALSSDGAIFAWQEPWSGILQIYRTDADFRVPLGQGSSFRFSKSGSVLLRFSSRSLFIHRADTGAVVRQIDLASTGVLSPDGEKLAWLSIASSGLGTGWLNIGDSLLPGMDSEIAFFSPAKAPALWASTPGSSKIPFSFTGDGSYIILSAEKGALDGSGEENSGGSTLYAVDVETGEIRDLGAPPCSRCCQTLAAGRFVLCIPPAESDKDSSESETQSYYSLLLFDPATGKSIHATDRLLSWSVTKDGAEIFYTDYSNGITSAELFAVDYSGRKMQLSEAYRFALSPDGHHAALITRRGQLKVTYLP